MPTFASCCYNSKVSTLTPAAGILACKRNEVTVSTKAELMSVAEVNFG